ncbi:MAG TPA: ATP-binding cassette domain-containing protein [Bacteroidales bacterium]|nr:ATP-binding cassette domain-containing protein [Bacteroidales bacterium]
MKETILEIQNLNKRYGKIHAVNDLSLKIKQGQIYGILGPNGSGKTTTLGIILGVINADSGSYKWFGQTPNAATRRKIGAILEHPNFLPYLSAKENLKIICQIRNVPYQDIDRVLQIVNLSSRSRSLYKTYSYGMKQRLAIAAALLGDPGVLILDEPTNGLDPAGIAEVRALIRKVASTKKTIILASHLLDEVQKICTHVLVIHNGKKIQSSTVEEIVNNGYKVEIEAADFINLRKSAEESPFIKSFSGEGNKLLCTLEEGKTAEEVNQYFFSKGIVLKQLNPIHQSLEQHFLALLNDD